MIAVAPTTGTTTRTQPENRVHYPALDGIRAIALMMVFGQHYVLLPWGYTGVDLFFVLSGFLITGILFDTVDRPDRVRSFYIRRSLRIFPLYYGLFALLVLLTPLLHFHWNRWWLVWPAYLGNIVRFLEPYSRDPKFLQPAHGWLALGNSGKTLFLGHLWSLSLEEQFYLAWPWVVFSIRDRRRLLWLCGFVVVLWPVLRSATAALLPQRYTELQLNFSFTPLRVDSLLVGALLALLIRGEHRRTVLQVCKWICAVALPLALLYVVRTVHWGQEYQYPVQGRFTWVQSLVGVLGAAVIGVALEPGNIIYNVCRQRWLRRIGQISYGAYVFHDIPHALYLAAVIQAARHVPFIGHHMRIFVLLVALCSTLILAQLSFHYVESPILNLKERWAPSRYKVPA